MHCGKWVRGREDIGKEVAKNKTTFSQKYNGVN